MTIHQTILYGEKVLSEHGLAAPRWNSERLLILALQHPRAVIYAELNRELAAGEFAAFEELLKKRSRHYPLAYLEGIQEFFGRNFVVNESVLIPRPETETIIHAVRELPLRPNSAMLDLGAGSGSIAVTLALEFAASFVVALEFSSAAIEVLRQNAKGRVHIVRSDFHSLCFQANIFDVITANLPYVENEEYGLLPPETKWEPRTALVVESLEESYGQVMRQCSSLLRPGGHLLMEFGYGQADRLHALAQSVPEFKSIRIRKDQRNIPRVLILQKAMAQ